ncbi:MAG: alpha/beta hydrolase [Actinomycetota bacterium]
MSPRLIIYLVVVLLVAFHLGGGWYFSSQMATDGLIPNHAPPELDVAINETGAGTVSLAPVRGAEPDLDALGVVGLDWEIGYGQLGRVLSGPSDDGSVTRALARLEGEPPQSGQLARLDGSAFPGDPDRAFGLAFSEVQYQSPLGPIGAWKVLAPNDTWVIHVHGLGTTRAEALRMLRPLVEAGYPELVIDYRNDAGAPTDPSGFYRYGQTEREDVGAAVDLAVAEGAGRVVLVGYSTGAAHVLSYLYQTTGGPVVGAVFDSPNIDFEQAVDLGASRRRLPVVPLPVPGSLLWTAKRLASIRFGVSWSATDYLPEAGQLKVPVLVFHGTEDETVPLSSSQDLASARPDLVRLVIVAGAGHVRSWNVGPENYESTVVGFLNELAG